MLGERIRTLVDGLRTANRYEVRWDGKDEGGRSVPSGVYMTRLQVGERSTTRKVTLLK